MKVVLTGSVAFDNLMSFPGLFREQILPEKLESLSLSFLVDSLHRHRGGIAGNIAYTLALLGERPHLMAAAGKDFGEYRAALEAAGVDTSLTKEYADCYTGSFFSTTDKANCQLASFYPGAMSKAEELSLRGIEPRPDWVVISPNDPAAMMKYARECAELKLPLMYDPSQQVARMEGADVAVGIDACKILICNEYEFGLIAKKTGRREAALEAAVEIVIVTLGEKGARIKAGSGTFEVPIVPAARVADPTGVGDAFRGGLLKGMMHAAPWEVCGRMGALSATYCLEEVGTQNHRFTRAEFLARYERAFGKDALVEKILS
ncbi:MAG: carbohydrate kinase family protein [Anaerolineales bacterium]|nr:carbohydrate kinase family protein [Anaerolineales bacterium]